MRSQLGERLSPRMIRRTCGGWLAVSNDADPVKIGVEADSEMAASLAFQATRERWRAILNSDAEDDESWEWG